MERKVLRFNMILKAD